MKERIGFEINIPEGSKIVHIPASEDLQLYLKKGCFSGKNHIDYLKEFLITKKNYDVVNEAYIKAKEEAIPESVRLGCPYCKGESDNEVDKACYKYHLQMQFTFVVAANEFVRLILSHQYIYKNKQALYNVTQDFFRSLVFIKVEGKMYFDLDAICRHILNAGFISLSEMFTNSDTLNTLKIINASIDNIEQKKLENELYNKEDEDYLDLQRKFYENKQRYYKEQLFIEEKEPNKNIKSNTSTKKENKKEPIPIIVLFYYFLQAAKIYPYFDNHPEGKLKAIEELIEKEKIITSAKNFQIEYNRIANHQSNRIAKNKANHILYVANNLLKNYPEAKKIALEEYQSAINKNR